MVRRGSFIGGQDNLSVPDAPTIGAATAGASQVSVAFTAPSDVGDDPITSFGVSVFPATGTTKTFRVTVASGNLYGGGTGNVFYIDGVSNPALTLVKGFNNFPIYKLVVSPSTCLLYTSPSPRDS